MIYKDFIAETAQKIMAADIARDPSYVLGDEETIGKHARRCVNAAKALADALDQDWQEQTCVDGVHRYAEGETFFDNYVNWTKAK